MDRKMIALGLYGIANRGSFTDITSEEGYLDRFEVGEIQGNEGAFGFKMLPKRERLLHPRGRRL